MGRNKVCRVTNDSRGINSVQLNSLGSMGAIVSLEIFKNEFIEMEWICFHKIPSLKSHLWFVPQLKLTVSLCAIKWICSRSLISVSSHYQNARIHFYVNFFVVKKHIDNPPISNGENSPVVFDFWIFPLWISFWINKQIPWMSILIEFSLGGKTLQQSQFQWNSSWQTSISSFNAISLTIIHNFLNKNIWKVCL